MIFLLTEVRFQEQQRKRKRKGGSIDLDMFHKQVPSFSEHVGAYVYGESSLAFTFTFTNAIKQPTDAMNS